jgi:hypothetical protein
MQRLLYPIAEAELDELDAKDIAAAEALGEVGRGMALAGASHADVKLAQENRVRFERFQQFCRLAWELAALRIPEQDSRLFRRGPDGRRRMLFDPFEQVPVTHHQLLMGGRGWRHRQRRCAILRTRRRHTIGRSAV